MAKTARSAKCTLKACLSKLSFEQACKLLGSKGERLILEGGCEEIEIESQVRFTPTRFKLRLLDATVTIKLFDGATRRLDIRCNQCNKKCVHMGAALSLILEEKMTLGLWDTACDEVILGHLSEKELVAKGLADRERRATEESMRVKAMDCKQVWSDYLVTNNCSGKAWRVALRDMERGGASYCSCPDFRRNTLGTCKHIIRVQQVVKRRFNKAQRETPHQRGGFAVYLKYGDEVSVHLATPDNLCPPVKHLCKRVVNTPIVNFPHLLALIQKLERREFDVTVYPDAAKYIQQQMMQEKLQTVARAMRGAPTSHPLKKQLLNVELLPHQMEGIAFAAKTGRAILADDMGLGKTLQGIGLAQLLAKECEIKRVLVICPASIKSQWEAEAKRFSNRDVQLVMGCAAERQAQYYSDAFFTVCNYEQTVKDILAIEEASWDLIILDEGQRIKNWETKTTRVIKGLKSDFALVLTGTPLENRLDDLFSVMEFVDGRILGPAFRFFNTHRVVDEKGKVIGYKKLDELRARLAPVLLRRTRKMVLKNLPSRTTAVVRVPATEEQLEIHKVNARAIRQIVGKHYITEMDLLCLRKALLACRMVANSTYLVTKVLPGHSGKLKRLEEMISTLAQEEGRKIVLFSEWTTMLNLIEPLFEAVGMNYVRLDGSVLQKKRQSLVDTFLHSSDCRAFLTTNAGSVGLNLQAADTVINVDLPWNPAVLEQRISRAHRMGQKREVQVYLFVTEGTIEENLLRTLCAKHELAMAALDMTSDVKAISLESNMDELKRRLEQLLGPKESFAQKNELDALAESLARFGSR